MAFLAKVFINDSKDRYKEMKSDLRVAFFCSLKRIMLFHFKQLTLSYDALSLFTFYNRFIVRDSYILFSLEDNII